MRWTACALVLAGLVAAPLAAQAPARVVGRVTDGVTGAPVVGAAVGLDDHRSVTGSDGGFVLGGLAPGRFVLDVHGIGYAPRRDVIDVVPGLERVVDLVLAPAVVHLDSLVVIAAPGSISMSGEALTRRGGDLARALEGWEGLSIRRTGSGGPASPQLRGGGPDEMLVLVDGFMVNDPLTGRADLGRFSSREVERVTLLPGAQGARAGGRAVAGVLLIESRRALPPEGTAWVAGHGGRGLRIGGSAGDVVLNASDERYADRFPYTVPEVRGGGMGERTNAGGELTTASARLEGPVEITLRGSQSHRGLPGTTTNPTTSAEAHDRVVFAGARGSAPLQWSASLQWLETRAADSKPPTGPAYDSYTHGVGGTAVVGYRSGTRIGAWSGEAGIAVEGRGDRFAGDGVRPGSSFSQGALRADASLHRGSATVWTLAPAGRLDLWTGQGTPAASVRFDAGWQRGRTAVTLAIGSAVTPPVLADLLFREGVGVRVNPDLRPERVRWETEAGVRREFESGSIALRGYWGRVADLVVWAPDFRFIWSPRNFDVTRHGGEITAGLRPSPDLRLDGTAAYSAVTYDIPGGAQVEYRPRVTYALGAVWSPGGWTADARWRRVGRRFPNSAGTNPRPAFSLLDVGLERRIGSALSARIQVSDLADRRAEFIAGYPTPGRTVLATLTFQLP